MSLSAPVCTVCRYNEEEISRKVSIYRQMLMDNLQNSSGTDSATVEKDDTGRPVYVQ